MIRNEKQDERIFDPDHIREILSVITSTFLRYFADFNDGQLGLKFTAAIANFDKEQEYYLRYFDDDTLDDYEEDANAFKKYTRNFSHTIIHNCLMAQDEIMDDYKAAFNRVSGRDLLNTVRNIAKFGAEYNRIFDGESHEKIEDYNQLELKPLDFEDNTLAGVVGYGIQSNFLYMLYPHAFAYRAQDAVWSLFFLTDKKHFDFEGGSEFVIYYPRYGTGEQNFLYPPELFGFYALKIYLMLKDACEKSGFKFNPAYRYVYLDTFLRHVAGLNRSDINYLKKNSENVEANWF